MLLYPLAQLRYGPNPCQHQHRGEKQLKRLSSGESGGFINCLKTSGMQACVSWSFKMLTPSAGKSCCLCILAKLVSGLAHNQPFFLSEMCRLASSLLQLFVLHRHAGCRPSQYITVFFFGLHSCQDDDAFILVCTKQSLQLGICTYSFCSFLVYTECSNLVKKGFIFCPASLSILH